MAETPLAAAGVDLELLRSGIRLMALRALGDPDAADDVAQESLARAVDALRIPDRAANIGAYVAGIARHVIADRYRANARVVSIDPAVLDAMADDRADVLSTMCSEEELCRVRGALADLSDNDRALIRLCYFEELSPTEIAARLGVPPERIRQRKLRALQRLRTAFDRENLRRHDDAPAPTIESGFHRAKGHGNAA
jgi:RNA polymerase sigma-70 factor (ECF subfamily)